MFIQTSGCPGDIQVVRFAWLETLKGRTESQTWREVRDPGGVGAVEGVWVPGHEISGNFEPQQAYGKNHGCKWVFHLG